MKILVIEPRIDILDATEIDDHESNWGILDQQEALKWVNNFIHMFNGDSSRITLSGCSAGSILFFHSGQRRFVLPVSIAEYEIHIKEVNQF